MRGEILIITSMHQECRMVPPCHWLPKVIWSGHVTINGENFVCKGSHECLCDDMSERIIDDLLRQILSMLWPSKKRVRDRGELITNSTDKEAGGKLALMIQSAAVATTHQVIVDGFKYLITMLFVIEEG